VSRYPVFIPSKGRWQPERALTARCLSAAGVPFKLVVEPQEADDYAAQHGEENVTVLPFGELGQGSIPARNWIKERATAEGHARHWQLDDNMRNFFRCYQGKRVRCPPDYALSVVENFTDRYENVGVSGPTYSFFGFAKQPPFRVNAHVYSCSLVNNAAPHLWRGRYNEDADLCLQLLAAGWCTLLVNAVQVNKATTMTVAGGNTDDLYQGDGRLKMAEALAERWPGVATVRHRYGRPTHHVNWGKFGPKLRLRDGLTLDPQPPDERVRLAAVGEVESPRLRRLLDEKPAEKSSPNRTPEGKINL